MRGETIPRRVRSSWWEPRRAIPSMPATVFERPATMTSRGFARRTRAARRPPSTGGSWGESAGRNPRRGCSWWLRASARFGRRARLLGWLNSGRGPPPGWFRLSFASSVSSGGAGSGSCRPAFGPLHTPPCCGTGGIRAAGCGSIGSGCPWR